MSNETTLQEAACWHARLHAPDCTNEDRTAFEQWRQSDRAHAEAYAIAERTSMRVDRLASGDARLRALAQLARNSAVVDGDAAARRRTRRWMIPAALAASVAVAVVTLRFLPDAIEGDAEAVAYESPANSTRTVTLSDGSSVQLDVATRMLVTMSPGRRQVRLLSGRAVFDVAHDRDRPFSVTAADSRTTALGTRFQVQLQAEQVLVTLAQGSVAVDNEIAARAWHEQLWPGEQLSVDMKTAARNKKTVDPAVVTSWARGRHLFRNTPLQEAIDEVNRYAQKKVRLGDPALADLTVGGNFIAGDSELIVAAFAAVLPLSVVDDGNREIILFRRYDVQN